jgi:tRNA A37 threonylcarbamoyladenosine biosynthesis protein TsaE
MQEYRGRLVLQHGDLYRLAPVEVDDLGLDELSAGAVMAVEWPARWRRAPEDTIDVTIEPTGHESRRLTIEGYSTR